MQVFSDLRQIPKSLGGCVITVGKFDGVHLGHQKLLHEAGVLARQKGQALSVLTFHPHPADVLQPERPSEHLMDQEDLLQQMRASGVEGLIVQKFDAEFANLSAEEFLRRLVETTSLTGLVVGHDFQFGKGKGGASEDLAAWAKGAGVELKRIPRVELEGECISSTAIKRQLREKNFERAQRMLGRWYFLRGEVVQGEGRGKTLGVPTANFLPTVSPPLGAGVYAGLAQVGEAPLRRAVLNIGNKPTFWRDRSYPLTFECHVLDWRGDFYGKTISFEPRKFLREERKFDGVQELKAQIQRDIDATRSLPK